MTWKDLRPCAAMANGFTTTELQKPIKTKTPKYKKYEGVLGAVRA